MKPDKSYKENLSELLTTFVKAINIEEKYYSDIAKVLSVNESEKTCNVEIINGAQIEDVRLQQVASDSGLYIIPSIDSIVIISYTDKTTAFISLFSQINSIIFQGGSNGGLTITPDLVTELDKNNNILSNLLNIINGAPIPEPGNGAPSAFQAALAGVLVGAQVGDFSNIENENFKH